MRVYFEKPRTTVGWKGYINDPHLDDSYAINEGLEMARRLLLDVLAMGQRKAWHPESSFPAFLTDKAVQMLSWLDAVTFRNGDVPMVNDAAWHLAPTTALIRAKAEQVLAPSKYSASLQSGGHRLAASGYRMFRQDCYELFADVGPVGPDHQPGHAHADTFSFVLYVNNRPVLVDSGTSTYELGERRRWERSTAAHNTVEVGGQNSSEVWSGFRVGRRARVTVLRDDETTLTARHDGYRRLGVVHERTWSVEPTRLCVSDRLISPSNTPGVARFYVHPAIPVMLVGETITVGPVQIGFSADPGPVLRLKPYEMADGFNRLRTGQCLEVLFTGCLETVILLTV